MDELDHTNAEYADAKKFGQYLLDHCDGASGGKGASNVASKARKLKKEYKTCKFEDVDKWLTKIERHPSDLPDDIWITEEEYKKLSRQTGKNKNGKDGKFTGRKKS